MKQFLIYRWCWIALFTVCMFMMTNGFFVWFVGVTILILYFSFENELWIATLKQGATFTKEIPILPFASITISTETDGQTLHYQIILRYQI